MDVQKQK